MPAVSEFDARNLDVDAARTALERDGVIAINHLLSADQLHAAQAAFRARLQQFALNDLTGYEQTELYRLMIEDVLLVDQSYVDLALHPVVHELVTAYIGDGVQLCEAKGWRSVATKREFHGWHADAWYDEQQVQQRIPRELKLGMYLTDVTSGSFNYLPGTHRKQPPSTVEHKHYAQRNDSDYIDMRGPAGSAFLFDTSGVHRQSYPMLQEREAIFYCFHDPAEPIQPPDVRYYRYHPLLLNAAFLGGLTGEQMRMLGFGDRRQFIAAHRRQDRHPRFTKLVQGLWRTLLVADIVGDWTRNKSRRVLGLLGGK